MSDQQIREKTKSTIEVKYHTAKKFILVTALFIFLIAGIGIGIFCRTHLQLAEREMLNEQHEIEQAWIVGAAEAVHAWESKDLSMEEALEQAGMTKPTFFRRLREYRAQETLK